MRFPVEPRSPWRAMLGSVLNQRFHLGSILRRGRSGVAYLATDEASGELFAVKVFAPGAGMEGPSGHVYRARLRQLGGLSHAHVIVPEAVGRVRGQWYVAAPYFPADSLESELARSGFTAAEGSAVLRQLAEGLAALHEQGAVHGGILPRRILVSRVDGVHAVLIDPARNLLSGGAAVPAGDARFSAPEQDPRHDLPVDRRADLYALGVIALRIVTGEPGAQEPAGCGAFRGHWAGIEADRVQAAPQVPAPLRPVLARLVAVSPEHRYASAAHLLAGLHGLGGGPAAAEPARQMPPVLTRAMPLEVEAPRKAIRDRFGQACSGNGGAVILQGWDGVGVEPVLRSAIPDFEAGGALLLRAGRAEGGVCPPLSVARQWFAEVHRQLDLMPPSHGDAIRIRFDRVASQYPSGLETLIPELTSFDPAAHPRPAETTWSPLLMGRFRNTMLARVCEALAALAAPARPLVLWIRELAAIDADSLHLLRLLLHRIREQPVLLVAGFHSPPGGGGAVETLLGAPGLRSSLARVALPLLTQRQTGEQIFRLLECAAGRNAAATATAQQAAERLYPMWFGVPWAQEQTLRLMVEEGVLVREAEAGNAQGPDWRAARPLKDWEAPESLAALVRRRWGLLPAPLRESLDAAAVLEAPFSEQAVAGLCDERPFEAVCEDLERCVSLGWLARQSAGYVFAEPLVQRTLYDNLDGSLDGERRKALHVMASAAAQGWLSACHLDRAGESAQVWSLAAPGMQAETWPACAATMLAPLSRSLEAVPEPERTEAAHRLAQAALALDQGGLAQRLLESHPGNSAKTQARACLLWAYALNGGDAASWVLRACELMGEPLPPGALGALLGKATLNRGRHAAPAQMYDFSTALPPPSARQSGRLPLLEAAAELMQDIAPEHAGILDSRILEEAAACEAPGPRLRALLRLGAHNGLPDGYYFLQARDAVAREELAHHAPAYHLAVGIAAAGELELTAAAEALARAAQGYRAWADPVGMADAALHRWRLARLTGPLALVERGALDLEEAAGAAGSASHALFAVAARIEADALAGRRNVPAALGDMDRLVSGARDTAGALVWQRLAAHALQWALLFRVRPDEGNAAAFAACVAPEGANPVDATLLLAAAEWHLAGTALGTSQDEQRTRVTHDALARASRAASRRRTHRAHVALLDSLSACVGAGFDAALACLEDSLVTAEVNGARLLSIHLWWRLAEGARRIGDARWMTWAGKALTACDALEARGLTDRVRAWIDAPQAAQAPQAALAAPPAAEAPPSTRREGPSARPPAPESAPASAEEIVSDGTVGIVTGRIRGLSRVAARAPNDWRQLLDRYYERLEFTLSLHRTRLIARGKTGWCAIAPAGALSAFWATHTIRPLVGEFYEELAGIGADDPLLLRTGIGVHAATALGEDERAPTVLAGDALPQAERLADLSAFLRAGPVLSPEMMERLPLAWRETLRPLGPWTLGTQAGPRELFAFAGTPVPGGTPDPDGTGGAGMLDVWNKALTAYRSRDWRSAIAAFKTYLAGHPGDRLGRLLLRHSQRRFTDRPRVPATTL